VIVWERPLTGGETFSAIRTAALDTLGPVDDQGVLDAAAVHRLLEVPERRVAGHGPAGVIMRIGARPAPVVVVAHVARLPLFPP